MSLYKAEQAVRQKKIEELVKVIAQTVDDWPKEVRVPWDLQKAIAVAVLDNIQY